MNNLKRAGIIILIEKLRLVETELFRLASKYGIKNVRELDSLVEEGKLSEKNIGEDLYIFDHMLSEKEKIEKELRSLNVKKENIWKSLQNLLELQKLSSQI